MQFFPGNTKNTTVRHFDEIHIPGFNIRLVACIFYYAICIQMQAPTHARTVQHKKLEGVALFLKSTSNPSKLYLLFILSDHDFHLEPNILESEH